MNITHVVENLNRGGLERFAEPRSTALEQFEPREG